MKLLVAIVVLALIGVAWIVYELLRAPLLIGED